MTASKTVTQKPNSSMQEMGISQTERFSDSVSAGFSSYHSARHLKNNFKKNKKRSLQTEETEIRSFWTMSLALTPSNVSALANRSNNKSRLHRLYGHARCIMLQDVSALRPSVVQWTCLSASRTKYSNAFPRLAACPAVACEARGPSGNDTNLFPLGSRYV